MNDSTNTEELPGPATDRDGAEPLQPDDGRDSTPSSDELWQPLVFGSAEGDWG